MKLLLLDFHKVRFPGSDVVQLVWNPCEIDGFFCVVLFIWNGFVHGCCFLLLPAVSCRVSTVSAVVAYPVLVTHWLSGSSILSILLRLGCFSTLLGSAFRYFVSPLLAIGTCALAFWSTSVVRLRCFLFSFDWFVCFRGQLVERVQLISCWYWNRRCVKSFISYVETSIFPAMLKSCWIWIGSFAKSLQKRVFLL